MIMQTSNKSIVVASNNSEFYEQVVAFFQKEGIHHYQVITIQAVLGQGQHHEVAAVIVDLDHRRGQDDSVLLTVQQIAARFPGSKIVCAGHELEVQLILKLVRVGANDFLKVPFESNEFLSLIKQIQLDEKTVTKNAQKKSGRIFTVFSQKGGVGVTLLTANLAVALARRKTDRVAVCDMLPQCGDVAMYMNLTPKYTIRDLVDQHNQLDSSLIEGVMAHHESGIYVLAAPREEQGPLTIESSAALRDILSMMKCEYDFVLIDGGHIDTPLLQTAIESSDEVLLIGNLDVPSLKGLVHSFNQLMKINYDTNRIKVIINRYNAKHQLNITEFQRRTKHPITCFLPTSYSLCIDAINTGRLLKEVKSNDDLVKEIDQLATYVRTENENEPSVSNHIAVKSSSENNEKSSTFLKGIFQCLF